MGFDPVTAQAAVLAASKKVTTAPLDLSAYESRQGQFPTFVRYSGNPIFIGGGGQTSSPLPNPWPPAGSNPSGPWPITRPWVVHVENLLSSPLGKFYMYFSTDHATDHGGIGLAYANSPLGPWTYYGLVYQDTTTGSTQTEWPCVVWDEDNACFNLYHHVVGLTGGGLIGGQITCLATSPNGVDTWTRIGPVIDPGLHNASTGNDYWSGGTSYPTVFRTANGWRAFLFGPTGIYNRSHLAYSNDGRNWQVDPRYLGDQASMIGGNQTTVAPSRKFLALNHVPIMWGGRIWVITLDSSLAAGSGANPCDFFAAPLTPNLRLFRAKPKKCMTGTLGSWETTFNKIGNVMAYGGKLYLYYRSGLPILNGGAGESFGVAIATPGVV